MIDVEAGLLVQYDAHGFRTETPLGPEHWELFGNSRAFTRPREMHFDSTIPSLDQHEIYSNLIEFHSYLLELYPYIFDQILYNLEFQPSFEYHERFLEQRQQYINQLEQSRIQYEQSLGQITPFFETGQIWQFVPFATNPHPWDGRSVFVGGGFFQTTHAHTSVELRTNSFPFGMNSLDAFFTNAWGDDTSVFFNVGPWREIRHNLRFPGEPYGVRVSSLNGPVSNVMLRFFANGAVFVPPPTITNPSFNGQQVNVQNGLHINWNFVPNATYRISLMNVTTNQYFGTWWGLTSNFFTIHSSFFVSGHQYRITVAAQVGNQTTWSERTFFAQIPITTPIIRNPSFDGQQFTTRDLHIWWDWAPNTSYVVTITDLTTNTIGVNTYVGTASSIFVGGFIPGRQYRVQVMAFSGGQSVSSQRTFFIHDPNTVNVNVRLYYDFVSWRDSTAETNHIWNVAHAAAVPFRQTHSIQMNFTWPNSSIRMKGNCPSLTGDTLICTPSLNNPYFLQPPAGTPAILNQFNCGHHSTGPLMLAHMFHHQTGLATYFTPGNICLRDPISGVHHTNIFGLAPWPNFMGDSQIRGNLAVVGFWLGNHWRDVRLTQHEWTHNYNVRDDSFGLYPLPCSPGQPCINRGITGSGFWDVELFDVWCDNCRAVVNANRARH